MDVHVIRHGNRHLYADILEDYFRLRHQIYVVERKWTVLDRPDKREIDQFDTDEAVYLIEAEAGRHLASMRLLPSAGPHLLSEVFPHLCAGPVPRGRDIFEATRLCTTPAAEKDEARRLRGLVWLGALQYAFAHGIRKITGVTHARFLQQILASGLDIEPLGLPQMHEGALIGAHIVHITPDDLRRQRARLADRGKAAGPALAEAAQ